MIQVIESSAVYVWSAAVLLVLSWCYSAYYLFLQFVPRRRSEDAPASHGQDERFHVIVPCYQEEASILAKLENTAHLDYPSELFDVVVVDGGSTDQTASIAEHFCRSQKNFRFVVSPQKGKIPQLNHVLREITDGLVVVTDVDGEVEPAALRTLAKAFADPRVGCVGALVAPKTPSPEDDLFWRDQNAMRLLESSVGHASTMIAVFYSFRRSLFDLFPDDVVADDVHVAFCSNGRGLESLYSTNIAAFEARSDHNARQMFAHKLRKLNANMKELVRFLPRVGSMGRLWRLMYMTKLAQHWVVGPLLLAVILLFIVSFARDGVSALPFWGGAALVVLVLQSLTQRGLGRLAAGTRSSAADGFVRKLAYVGIFHLVLVVGFFRYFVVRQSSSYRRVNQ